MHMIHPTDIERYCLRLLLLHVPGAQCFEDIRTFNGIVIIPYFLIIYIIL